MKNQPNNNQRVQKLITFSPKLFRRAEWQAKLLGISFAEYLRYLIINDGANFGKHCEIFKQRVDTNFGEEDETAEDEGMPSFREPLSEEVLDLLE